MNDDPNPKTKEPAGRTVRPATTMVCRVEAETGDGKRARYTEVSAAESPQKAMAGIRRGEYGEGMFQVISIREKPVSVKKSTKPVWEAS